MVDIKLREEEGGIKSIKPCCRHWLSVGYVWNPKNEFYYCKECGKVYFSANVGKFKKFLIRLFARHFEAYDDRQVRVYFPLGKPTVVADISGETIEKLEEGLEGVKNEEEIS